MKLIKIKNIDQLRDLAAREAGLDAVLLLNGGLQSSKFITYDLSNKTYNLHNYIDDTMQTLTEEDLHDATQTNLARAMAKGALYAEMSDTEAEAYNILHG